MATTYLQKMRLFSRDVRLFLITTAFALDGIRAVLLNLYLLRLGYDPEFIGLVNGVAALTLTLFCLLARWARAGAIAS